MLSLTGPFEVKRLSRGIRQTMQAPEISIITRTRDRPQLLRRAVDSVLGQESPPEWEWIVVNDAGDPGTLRNVLDRALDCHGDRIHLLQTGESRGMEHASNLGIRQAKGRLLVIHDDDDSWDPSFLERMSAFLGRPENRRYAGVVCHSIRIVEEVKADRIVERDRHPFNDWLREIGFWRILKENAFPPISFLFRRGAYEEVGPFNEDLPVLGDWEFNLRVLARHALGVLPEPLAFYHHRPPSVNSAYANSVTGQDQRHREVEARLRMEWAKGNPFGLPRHPFAEAALLAGNLHRMQTGLRDLAHRAAGLPEAAPPQF